MEDKSKPSGEEQIICEITPSQILNLKAFLLSIIAIVIIVTVAILADMNVLLWLIAIPLLYGVWKYLEINAITP